MKIKKIKVSKNKLLKLQLIQTKIYNKKQYLDNIKIEDIEYELKKIFYIIYKYHILNKRILFIDSSSTLNLSIKKLFKTTNHILIPIDIWVKGSINNKASLNHLSDSKKKISEILLKLKKSIDLVVILEESSNFQVLNEAYISKIPTISVNCFSKIQYNKSSYAIFGNFQFLNKIFLNSCFYSLLTSTFRK